MSPPAPPGFRQRLLAGEPLFGTFLKIPTSHPAEILAGVGYDFLVIDEEHAPWDRVSIDQALLGARAGGAAGLVRVADPTPARILACLDDGAAGVMVPHVQSAARARELAQAFRFRGGRRGASNSTRAGGYGALSLWDHVAKGDAEACFIAMIEDPEALEELDAILSVEGVDAVFIGRADLTVAMGAASVEAPEIVQACDRIIAAARRAGKPVALLASGPQEAAAYRAQGVSCFLIATDVGFMRMAAAQALKAFGAT